MSAPFDHNPPELHRRATPATPLSFPITIFPDLSGTTLRVDYHTVGSFKQLIVNTVVPTRKDQPLYSGARFGHQRTTQGSYRSDDNVVGIYLVTLDYDNVKPPAAPVPRVIIDVVHRRLVEANITHIIYTTGRHTEQAARFRLALPLSREWPKEELTRFVEEVNALALGGGAAPESLNVSQSWYYGRATNAAAFEVYHHEGIPLDLHTGLQRRPLDTGQSGKTAQVGSGGGNIVNLPSGARPAHLPANDRGTSINNNAQANWPGGWFDELTPAGKNALLEAILQTPEFIAIADGPRGKWRDMLFAAADAGHRGADRAREIALDWCKTSSSKFVGEADFNRDWNSFKPDRPGGIGVGSLLAEARDAGFDFAPFLAHLGTTASTGANGSAAAASGTAHAGGRRFNIGGTGTIEGAGTNGSGGGASTGAAGTASAGTNSSGTAGWTPPQALPIRLLPVPLFDPAWLPDLVRPFCLDIASSLPCPLDYVAVNLFTCLGTVLGNRLLIEVKVRNSWLEAPNIWGLAIGGVTQMKTPSARPFMQQMNRLQDRELRRHAAAMQQYHSVMAVHQAVVKQIQAVHTAAARQTVKAGGTAMPPPVSVPNPPPEPQLKHYFTTDATYEKLGELCAGNPYGVLVYGDELSGLLALLNREEMRKARTFYLEGFNGTSSYKVDRIGRGTILLPRFAIGVLGNIQPDLLSQLLMMSTLEGQQNDGLAQRFGLMVWPDPVPLAYVDQPRPLGASRNVFAVFDAFAELDPQKAGAGNNPGHWEWFIRLDQTAHVRFVDWLNTENFPARQNPDLPPAMQEHLGKYPKLVLGLSLMLHLMDLVQPTSAPPEDPQGSIPQLTPIPRLAIERAIAIARYAEGHARRVYQAAADPAYATARLLAKQISKGALSGTVRARLVTRHRWSGLGDPEQVTAGMELLEDFNWVRRQELRSGVKGGRPTVEWLINPLGLGVPV